MDTATLERLQTVELEILDEVVRICSKFNLSYFLVGGTLLGAIRHKGFIPWDDDIDIGMPRKDYERFIEISRQELDSKYYLLSAETYPPYWLKFAKVCKRNTLFMDKNIGSRSGTEHQGIFIDIFPYDTTLNIGFVRLIKRFIIDKLHALLMLKCGEVFSRAKFTGIKQYISKTFSFEFFHKFIKMTMLFGLGRGKYLISWCGSYGDKKETFLSEVFFPLGIAEFEGKQYSAPNQKEKYLHQIYGDFMRLPPEKDRKTHDPELIVFDMTDNSDNKDSA